ncbi:hypothetical protein ACIBH1_05385 [Nonomuraea sp. NPDC050663]|uniref:hypothetical protein n=1 Tax=Nonomuraea sp. NPDC050663 TaxID=3364370 RepID=UPI00378AA663
MIEHRYVGECPSCGNDAYKRILVVHAHQETQPIEIYKGRHCSPGCPLEDTGIQWP